MALPFVSCIGMCRGLQSRDPEILGFRVSWSLGCGFRASGRGVGFGIRVVGFRAQGLGCRLHGVEEVQERGYLVVKDGGGKEAIAVARTGSSRSTLRACGHTTCAGQLCLSSGPESMQGVRRHAPRETKRVPSDVRCQMPEIRCQRHATCDMRHATCDMRHATCDVKRQRSDVGDEKHESGDGPRADQTLPWTST
eukprot:2039846-Rhodomonas_salina.3